MYPTKNLSLMGSLVIAMKKDVIEGMWKGVLPRADNDIDINLADGTFGGARSFTVYSRDATPAFRRAR
jgi:hypothetical protein